MIDFTGVEGVHSGDNGMEMNGLQMHSAPLILAHLETFSQVGVVGFGTMSELSIRHIWRQMGEQNVHNLGTVNDEEEDIESAYSRNNWDPKLEVGKIFSSKEALSNKLQLAAVRGHFEFKVKQSCKSRLVVVCSQGPCPWRLRASSYGEKNFMIVKYNPVH
ncbi:PREDICTED: FAR1-RELATED SEQUENCE [Prunus dulcis]|uniref:PREDICTED: FAR1-RELATED SEQUENCE n=1 Tax=Prunus dulcis TaxID=3755 RepID=A0A5E4G2M0_PRUDU|nr:PREDICTED: FAR1-RELATED SEQUENCE [Prunus dulcis]